MKIVTLDLKNNFVKLRIDNLDDIWLLSRMIEANDVISGETTRAVKKTEEQESKRKKIFIKIIVEKTDFQKQTDVLRVLGTITESTNTDVPNGSHHSLTISPGDLIGINKEFKKWQVDRLKEAEASAGRPKVLLCSADYGEAVIAVLQEYGIRYLTEISRTIPGKKKETLKAHEKEKENFLVELAKTLEEILSSQNLDKAIIGGLGFFNENFAKVLEKFPVLQRKAILINVSSTGKPGINELIKRGAVEQVVKGNRMAKETELIERFFAEISKDGLAVYGNEDVKEAIGYGAVEILLVPDTLIQESKESGEYDALDTMMQDAEKQGATIMIISSEHEAGERISKIGIAAILRYKI
jgi:protein pelota